MKKETFETMFSFLVIVSSIARVCSFPQNYYEGNFGYDPFGGTFHHQLPPNPEYVPPVEYPSVPPPAKAKHDSYVPMIDGKPIYIPEVYHDGFVFRDMTLPDPNEPLHQWPQNPEANFYPQSGVKTGVPVKKVKPHHSKRKQRHYPKGNLGARSAHKKPVAHDDEYDDPVVVQSFSKVEQPVIRQPTYDYESITKFLGAEHDFSQETGLPVESIVPNEIENEVAIESLTNKGKPVIHKKPIKQKLPPVAKPIYQEYEGNKASIVDPLTKHKPVKKPIKHKPTSVAIPVYPEYEELEASVVDPLTKHKPVKKPIKHKPTSVVIPVYPEYEELESSVVDPLTKHAKPVKKPTKHKPAPVMPVYPEYEGHEPLEVDPLTKKPIASHKPIMHVKPVPVKKPTGELYVEHDIKIVEAFTENENAAGIQEEDQIHTEDPANEFVDSDQETPIIDAFSNKNKHEGKPIHKVVKDEYENPVVVEAFSKNKRQDLKEDEVSENDLEEDYDDPLVVEVFTNKKPVTHPDKPVLIAVKEEYDTKTKVKGPKEQHPTLIKDKKPNRGAVEYVEEATIEGLTKKKKPVVHVKHQHKKPGHQHKKPGHHHKIKVQKESEYEPDKVIVEKEKHYPDEKVGHNKHPDPVHLINKDNVEDEYEYDDELGEGEDHHVSQEKIVGKNIDVDYSDYDDPDVVEVLTKKEKPVSEEYDPPNVVEVLTKKEKHPEKVVVHKEEEYEEPEKVIVEKHHPHEKDGHKKHPHSVHPIDKDDVEVDYEPVDEWDDEDKDYELGGELESRDFEGSDDESLEKDVDAFDGSGSVSDVSEKPEGRSFLPVDPSVWTMMSHLHSQERRKFKSCLTPTNESGNCMPIQMCAVPNFASNIDELLKNVCVIDEVFIGICCPEFPVDTVKVQWDQFVEQNKSDSFNEESVKECGKLPEVVNKTVAWPWMAPLVAASTGKVFCGGALINEQYVLSAAHCTKKIPHNRILIRLGSLDTDKPSDEDFEVVEIKRHAQYNPRNMANDIALLKLSRRVPLGDFRGLICLPEDDDDYNDESAILLGWKGFSEKMDDIESLNVISNENCQRKMGVLVENSVVCTQPRTEQGKCNEDSGAPLVIGKDKQFKVIGVLTWNRNDCDTRFPSIFTRVSEYRRWIQRHAV